MLPSKRQQFARRSQLTRRRFQQYRLGLSRMVDVLLDERMGCLFIMRVVVAENTRS